MKCAPSETTSSPRSYAKAKGFHCKFELGLSALLTQELDQKVLSLVMTGYLRSKGWGQSKEIPDSDGV